MSVRTEAMRAAVLGALKDLIDGEYQHARGKTLDELLDVREETGAKSLEVFLPDGTPVAGITLVGGDDTVEVADRAAFTEWVAGRAPGKVTQEQPIFEYVKAAIASAFEAEGSAWTSDSSGDRLAHVAADAALAQLGIHSTVPDPKVDPKYETQILDEVEPLDVDEDAPKTPRGVVLPETGEVVPGVEYRPAPEPKSFQMRYKKDGRKAVARAWRAHKLDGIEGLPEIQP